MKTSRRLKINKYPKTHPTKNLKKKYVKFVFLSGSHCKILRF